METRFRWLTIDFELLTDTTTLDIVFDKGGSPVVNRETLKGEPEINKNGYSLLRYGSQSRRLRWRDIVDHSISGLYSRNHVWSEYRKNGAKRGNMFTPLPLIKEKNVRKNK
jgi:hypothetical protein